MGKFYCNILASGYIQDYITSAILLGYDNESDINNNIVFDFYNTKMLLNGSDIIR